MLIACLVRGAPRRVNQAALSIPRKVPGGGVAMRGTHEKSGCAAARLHVGAAGSRPPNGENIERLYKVRDSERNGAGGHTCATLRPACALMELRI